MAAPTLAALLDFESAFEKAAQAILSTSGINGYISQQNEKVALVSTSLSFDTGPAIDELTILPLGGRSAQDLQDFFRYTGELTLEISVNRDTAQTPADAGTSGFLSQCRGRIRGAFMQSQWPFNDTNLPFYRVSEIRPAGTVTGFDQTRNADLVSIKFAITFAIQPTAWPAGFPPA